jgi:transposase InsO family protein
MGQQVHQYENRLNRQFYADRPNAKWVAEISYIHTGQGVLYLSMIRDLYDNSIVAYKTGTQQTVNLVLDTIHLAMKREKKKVAVELQLHSDQGLQYTSQAYFNLIKESGIHRPCQGEETAMTTLWLKISSPFSKRSASTATSPKLCGRQSV